MKKLLLFAIVILGFSAVSFGQNPTVSTTAIASANIITPISIQKVDDLVFGNIAVKANEGGTVTMTPEGTRSRTNGVSLPATTGTFNAASFTVSGETGYHYTLAITPSTLDVINGQNSMTISSFSDNSTGVIQSGGSETVGVGGLLTVGQGQATGTYTSTDKFTVTVNYN